MTVLRNTPKLDNSLINLENSREIINPIAYNLKQLKSHELIRLDDFEADLRFKNRLNGHFSTIASSNSLILDFVVC